MELGRGLGEGLKLRGVDPELAHGLGSDDQDGALARFHAGQGGLAPLASDLDLRLRAAALERDGEAFGVGAKPYRGGVGFVGYGRREPERVGLQERQVGSVVDAEARVAVPGDAVVEEPAAPPEVHVGGPGEVADTPVPAAPTIGDANAGDLEGAVRYEALGGVGGQRAEVAEAERGLPRPGAPDGESEGVDLVPAAGLALGTEDIEALHSLGPGVGHPAPTEPRIPAVGRAEVDADVAGEAAVGRRDIEGNPARPRKVDRRHPIPTRPAHLAREFGVESDTCRAVGQLLDADGEGAELGRPVLAGGLGVGIGEGGEGLGEGGGCEEDNGEDGDGRGTATAAGGARRGVGSG